MSDCCAAPGDTSKKAKTDWLFIIFSSSVAILYAAYLINIPAPEILHHLFHSTFDLMNKMWWGLVLGAFFVGVLDFIPRDLVMALLGQEKGIKGLVRATIAGLLLDLCSHGILMVGMKIYDRGARLGQVMAFLIASPWNSLSLTIILAALIGFKWTLIFILLSAVIAIISGLIIDRFVATKVLPENPNLYDLPKDYNLKVEIKKLSKKVSVNPANWINVLILGFKQSKSILKWLFLGVLVASAMQAFIDPSVLKEYMGPSVMGLAVTLFFATIIEVCSEGTTPIAADIFTRAHAPGNAFAFLMTGVSTDYTEIMAIKETTKSWKVALFLPLVTVPQIVVLSLILNSF